MHVVVWKNKFDFDSMSIDDLYNNLKVYEPEVKGVYNSSTNTQNMAFVSSSLNNNTNSNNEAVNTAFRVTTAGTQVNAAHSTNIDNLSDVVICAFLKSQSNKVMIGVTRLKMDLTMHLWHTPLQVLILGFFMPPKHDLSYIGLEEFTSEPAIEILNAKTSEEVPKVVKKDNGARIIKDWKSDNEDESVPRPKIEKKTVKPSVAKVEFVKPKQQSQNARKTIKNVKKSRQSTNSKRGNQRN
uniref:Uncharacterized protein n=1 Tax=Tanacetum cinerariifolium TaxID=118510 RepID=A0A6L2LLX1_TANCI|nr:hypothetical protein [Tanacetum cinerariifolium]